jgi:hydrogenase-4 transcriptional activator
MERYNELLLDVWREACRHIEIAEATDLITPLLLRQLPLDQLLLRIVELDRGTVDTVAATTADRHRPANRLRTEVCAQ